MAVNVQSVSPRAQSLKTKNPRQYITYFTGSFGPLRLHSFGALH
jgi:hypothetical protein